MNWRGWVSIVAGVLVVAGSVYWLLYGLPAAQRTSVNYATGYLRHDACFLGIPYASTYEATALAELQGIPESEAESRGRWLTVSEVSMDGKFWESYAQRKKLDSLEILAAMQAQPHLPASAYQLSQEHLDKLQAAAESNVGSEYDQVDLYLKTMQQIMIERVDEIKNSMRSITIEADGEGGMRAKESE